MANLDDSGDTFPDIYQFDQTDPLLSGPPNEATGAGMDNIPHLQLARRTRWLKTRVDQLLQAVVNATTNVAGIVKLNNTVTSESVAEAATANAVRLANNNAIARVPQTRTISGAGLATGGGALDQNRIITVPKATQQQAIDGVADDVALTPKTGRALIEAQLGGGDEGAAALVPTGAIMDFAMQTPPNGWLVCDGSQQSRTEHAALFAAIGIVWGAGNGTTTFNLPDFRGEFRRGWDAGRGADAGRTFGSTQSGQIQSHSHSGTADTAGAHAHTFLVTTGFEGGVGIDGISQHGGAHGPFNMSTSSAGGHSHNVSINATGGAETRPRNIAVLTCIKA